MKGTNRQHLPPTSRAGVWVRTLATYDVFPAFSARVRRVVYSPLGVLSLAALTALMCGVFLHAHGYVLGGSVVAVILLGVSWPWVSLCGLHGCIAFGRTRGVEGEPVEVCLTLTNRLPWAVHGLAVHGGANAGAEAMQPSVTIAGAPRRRTSRCRWMFTPARRGVYPLASPLVTTGFPFGVWENRRSLSVAAPLLVWPRSFPVGPVPLVSGDQLVEGNVSRNKVGSNGDVLGVRPYRRGDSPRRIHWGQSARHDRLIVCELQANARPVVQLVLDVEQAVHAGQGPDSSREWAIRIVASLVKGWLGAGVEIGAAWNGRCIPASSGAQQLTLLLDGLAELPDTAGPPLADVLADPACRSFTTGLQVIVTTDRAVNRLDLPRNESAQQRWVILQVEGFAGAGSSMAPHKRPLGIRPWLLIDTPSRIPSLLAGGWKEARHGS
jgi:uncharacterized protein (DUF58 family)